MTCTFFGNREINQESVENSLWEKLIYLVENMEVNIFFVGNQGEFDNLVIKKLKRLREIYPHIKYFVALAYVPRKNNDYSNLDYSISFVPEGVENGPQRFAIDRRNRWLINNSDYIITCIRTKNGGAEKYKKIAQRKGKNIIEI